MFVSFSMLREAYDDYHRHLHDSKENHTYVQRLKFSSTKSSSGLLGSLTKKKLSLNRPKSEQIFSSGDLNNGCLSWEIVYWKELSVGDIVKVKDKEFIPADLILLKTDNCDGICYIETANLDGETNLKQKQALPVTNDFLVDDVKLMHLKTQIHAESPNGNLYHFEGYLEMGERYPLTASQLLLRGSTLANSGYIIGVATYTGEETKIRMNANEEIRYKSPMVDQTTNKIILAIFCSVLTLAAISTVNMVAWNVSDPWYLRETKNPVTTFFSFVILYNTLIPISLYVTLEMVKLVQIYFINHDLMMYCEASGRCAEANTSSLNEDLGQVQYLFTDKTGTLTENIMIFRKMSSLGLSFSLIDDPKSTLYSEKDFPAKNFIEDIKKLSMEDLSVNFELGVDFLRAIALCHDCSLQKSTEENTLAYQSSSPDEVALVSGAKQLGFTFKSRIVDSVTVEFEGEVGEFKILNILEFSSKRKRMSVIYRFPDGKIILICKGADSVIIDRLDAVFRKQGQSKELFTTSLEHVSRFATEGLRTMLYATKEISETDYEVWSTKYKEAAVSLENRSQLMEALEDEIENDLNFLGATAIEDKLQFQVPETIEKLQRAGIKVWMLTGDKRETAINIGYSCELIKEYSELILFKSCNKEELNTCINNATQTLLDLKTPEQQGILSHPSKHVVAIVDGDSFLVMQQEYIKVVEDVGKSNSSVNKGLLEETLLSKFFRLAVTCSNVICCRFSPSQKSFVVSNVKNMLKKSPDGVIGLYSTPRSFLYSVINVFKMRKVSGVTLAIGDGANDIPMLESAHVGVGITGREGLAASRTSDYAIAQFRFLQPLLFVHGRYSYQRVALFTLGTFYKSVTCYMCQLFFQNWAAWSGTSLFEPWTLSVYNILFSSLPVLVVGMFEKDLNISTLLNVPELYRSGQVNHYYNIPLFIRWVCQGLIHAAIAVIVPFYCYNGGLAYILNGTFLSNRSFGSANNFLQQIFFSDATGKFSESSLISIGTVSYTLVILLVTMKISFLESHNWTIFTFLAAFFSIGGWWLFQAIYSIVWPYLGEFGYDSLGLIFVLGDIQIQIWSISILGSILGLVLIDLNFNVIRDLWVSPWHYVKTDLQRESLKTLLSGNESPKSPYILDDSENENNKKTPLTFLNCSKAARAVCKAWKGEDLTYAAAWFARWESIHNIGPLSPFGLKKKSATIQHHETGNQSCLTKTQD
ncbi:Phospholipid-transporting ATPase IA [Clydaea vesicula]|uniref:Phospholipid-transporting ATPase n=1 Tax=Clydaea vesicula TaxID=447962 RepID=A0AAD5XUB3_9FUNG|nr:Phospholipid-transporting ATPase IA [Clydaea vesicula]